MFTAETLPNFNPSLESSASKHSLDFYLMFMTIGRNLTPVSLLMCNAERAIVFGLTET